MSKAIAVIGQLEQQELDDWLYHLQLNMPEETFIPLHKMTAKQKQESELAVVANPEPADVAQLPNLNWVHSVWAGVEKLIAKFAGSDLKLVRLKDPALTHTMTEAVLTWSLFLQRDFHLYQMQQKHKDWSPLHYRSSAKTRVGILGLGELGQATAARLKQNGFSVCGWSRSEKKLDGVQSFFGQEGIKKMVSDLDILVGILPSTPGTQGLLNQELFNQCKPGCHILNFGRGSLINDEDLLNALNQDKIGQAVLDVFNQEPLPKDHPYWSHEKVTVLPHISAHTQPETASLVVAENINRFRATGQIPELVDFSRGY